MPKQVFTLPGFHGGLNNKSAPRDLVDIELSELEDLDVTTVGKLLAGPTEVGHEIDSTNWDADAYAFQQNYYMFMFSHDRGMECLYITLDGAASGAVAVGDYVGDGSDFTGAATAVGFVYKIDGNDIYVTKHKNQGSFGVADSIYVGTSFEDASASDSGRDINAVAGTSFTNQTPEYYESTIVFGHDAQGSSNFYSRYGGKWFNRFDYSSASSGVKPSYYAFDGELRASDTVFTNGSRASVRFYHRALNLQESGSEQEGWITEYVSLDAPTRGIVSETSGALSGTASADATSSATVINNGGANSWSGLSTHIAAVGDYEALRYDNTVGLAYENLVTISGATTSTLTTATVAPDDWDDDDYYVLPNNGTGFNLAVSKSASGGTWDAGTWEVAITFVYMHNQESLPYELTGTFTTVADDRVDVIVYANGHYNETIIGGRIYFRRQNSGESWQLLGDISLEHGVRSSLANEYLDWDSQYSTVYNETLHSYDKNVETYEILNGFGPDQESISFDAAGAGWKHAVVAGNRRVYVGNVRYTGPDGTLKNYGDLVLKSRPNKPDTFLWEERIEVATGDGEEITALVEYADRLLQFKERTLYIVNISQEIEFLEDKKAFLGVTGEWQVCPFENGVAWVNRKGFFIYDGQQVHDMLRDKNGKLKIDWDDFFDTEEKLGIGYNPEHRQFLIHNDSSGGADADVFLYDTKLNAFMYFPTAIGTTGTTLSNIINDWDGKLLYTANNSGDVEFQSFDVKDEDGASSRGGRPKLVTKEFDFGNIRQPKVFYGIDIRHKGVGSSATVRISYSTDAGVTWTSTDKDAANMDLTDNANLSNQSFDLGIVEDKYSMMLKIETTVADVDSDFEIDEISITYRPKIVV